MLEDAIIITTALILTGIIYGTINGCSIASGEHVDRKEISQVFKLFLIMAFPFTLSAIGSAKLAVWILEEDPYDAD